MAGTPLKAMGQRHGAQVVGLGKVAAKMGGVGTFAQKGTTMAQDISRNTSMKQVGNEGPRGSNDGNPGVKSGRTGNKDRKRAGVVGFQKATGTKQLILFDIRAVHYHSISMNWRPSNWIEGQ